MSTPIPLLELIRKHESLAAVAAQGVASPYDAVWSGIWARDRPLKPLTKMTVAEVLAWQDRIDARYRSEAAGAYQILEDTLRGLNLDPFVLFDEETQDRAAMLLLERRGWSRLLRGEITPERFGDSLAREWASLPVLTDQRGASRRVMRGQSYYAGDGRNKALATPAEVEVAIAEALLPSPPVLTLEERVASLEARMSALEAYNA